MPYECEDCGRRFETLTRLRLHDCSPGTDSLETDVAETSGVWTTDSPSDAVTVDTIDTNLQRVSNGEPDAIYGALAAFESELQSQAGVAFQDLFWAYYEPLSDALDTATVERGWRPLAEVTDAYDPARDDTLPVATPIIANAVGRHVIRTRLVAGVAPIPDDALDYLDGVANAAEEGDDLALEELHALGWGIGHPEFDLVARLTHRPTEALHTINPTLEHAFYADQHAAIEILGTLLDEQRVLESLAESLGTKLSPRRYLLDAVYGPATPDDWPTTPRYWDWRNALDFTFAFDPEVKHRIRELVRDTGIDEDLPDECT